MSETPAATGTRRFLTFRINRDHYALPAEEIAEIIHMPEVAHLPQSPKALLGMANLRGTVVAVASLRVLLGQPATAATARAIVLNGASPVALAIDAVDAMVSVDASHIETRPAELAAKPGEVLRGAFRLNAGDDAAKILDIQAMLATAFVPRKASPRQRPARLAPNHAATQEALVLLVSFEVAAQEFALALGEIQEIIPVPLAIAALPHGEALTLGVTLFRNTLLPLFSLRGLLGLPAQTIPDWRAKIIVTSVVGVPVGLLVDRVRAIVHAAPGLIEPIPVVLAARTGGETRIKAIYRGDDGRLISILTADQLFGDDVMKRLGTATSQGIAAPVLGKTSQFLVFRLGDEEYGLPIGAVDEVAAVPASITHLPKTPEFLQGVTNLRGEVLPVIDQRQRFDMAGFTGEARRQRLIVVRTAKHRAGLIVDGVSEVLTVADDAVEDAPDLAGDGARLVHGVINLETVRRMILLLDPAELLSRTEHGLLDAFTDAVKAV